MGIDTQDLCINVLTLARGGVGVVSERSILEWIASILLSVAVGVSKVMFELKSDKKEGSGQNA